MLLQSDSFNLWLLNTKASILSLKKTKNEVTLEKIMINVVHDSITNNLIEVVTRDMVIGNKLSN